MKIRALEPTDIARTAALLRDSLTQDWADEQLAAELDMPNVAWMVAVEHAAEGGSRRAGRGRDRIVGAGALWLLHEEAHITALAVAPDRRGRGVGAGLLEALIAIARSTPAVEIILEVRVSNAEARAFYARHGFSEIGRRAGYYPPHGSRPAEDAIVLARSVAP